MQLLLISQLCNYTNIQLFSKLHLKFLIKNYVHLRIYGKIKVKHLTNYK